MALPYQKKLEQACVVWQFPSKEEEQHTFRTTPREHWWFWSECPS